MMKGEAMKGFVRSLMIAVLVVVTACTQKSRVRDDDMSLEDSPGAEAPADADVTEAAPGGDAGADDFAEFEDEKKPAQKAPKAEDDLSLDVADSKEPAPPQEAQAASGGDELSLDDPGAQASEPVPPTEPAPPVDIAPPVESPDQALAPPPEEPAIGEPAPVPSGLSQITATEYKGNDVGGTFVIEGSTPLTYQTRHDSASNQFIVEVPNATIAKSLQRTVRTKDASGAMSSMASAQGGGDTVRFVVQLKPGASEPLVQQEGNNLLIVGGATIAPIADGETPAAETPATNVELGDSKILVSQSLADFLSGNTKFYGKRISIETSNMDIRDALRFLTEESGVNMVVSDDVKGNISLKLRQVPWDQALVVIMKARRLGYTRQGNVLRISPQDQLKQEEDDATKLVVAKRAIEPLKVRMFPISYAKVDDLEKRLKDFMSERGRTVSDIRTNSIVVTDIAENLDRVAKIIASLDTQPPQVLIEGKIVEAGERFTRSVGINWGFNGSPVKLGTGRNGPVNFTPGMSASSGTVTGGNAAFNMTLGSLDLFGDLTAQLSLSEQDDKVKVLSSPRILTLTNEVANISQTTEVAVRQVTQNGTTSTDTFTFKPLTLKLEVTPQITADSSIIMKVNVKREFQGAVQSNGSFSVNSREANSRILVKNGQTAVIGGIYQSDATDSEAGVPWLRELPVVGALFRGRTNTKDKSELLIFLTPRIVSQTQGTPPSSGEL